MKGAKEKRRDIPVSNNDFARRLEKKRLRKKTIIRGGQSRHHSRTEQEREKRVEYAAWARAVLPEAN